MLAVCLFSACDSENSDDLFWDITPVEFYIFITDSEGHDLLDSTFQNNLIKDITVSYQSKTYSVVTEHEYYERLHGKAQTRAYMPNFYGLILRKYGNHKMRRRLHLRRIVHVCTLAIERKQPFFAYPISASAYQRFTRWTMLLSPSRL